jgi:hypothetical protein
MIEFRSRWINDGVRAQSQALTAMNGNPTIFDARYQRKKAEAIAVVPQLLAGFGMNPEEQEMFRLRLIPPTTIPNIPRVNPPPPGTPESPGMRPQPNPLEQGQPASPQNGQQQQQITLAAVQGFPGLFAAVPVPPQGPSPSVPTVQPETKVSA